MSRGRRCAVVLLTFILMLTAVHAINENPVVDFTKMQDTLYIFVTNPSNLNVTIYIYDRATSQLNQTFSTTSSVDKFSFSSPGAWVANISIDGTVVEQRKFSIGTIFNTGFKDAVSDLFQGDLTVVGIVIMIGVGVWAASIGRYAGLPVVLGALGILTALNYFPAWMVWVLLLVVVVILAKAVAELLRSD